MVTIDPADGGHQPIGGAAGLAELLEVEILSGQRRAGERLPTVRDQALRHNLAPNTVAAAYRLLGRRGLVEGRGRQGTVVTGEAMLAASLAPPPDDGLHDLASGGLDITLLPDLEPHLKAAAAQYRERPTNYGCETVAPKLVEAVTASWAPWPIGDELTVVPGAMGGVSMALASLRPGDRVAIEDPGYSPIRANLAARGLKSIPVSIDDQGMDPGSLSTALATGIRAVLLTPRAQNPTGAALTVPRANKLASLLAQHPDVLVIEDDHAAGVAGADYGGLSPILAERGHRWLLIRSVAKSLGPDLRLAIVTGDGATMTRLHQQLTITIGWVPHILQNATASLLTDQKAIAQIDIASKIYSQRRQCFVDAMGSAGVSAPLVVPRTGFNVWVRVDDEAAAVAAMARAGFAVAAGSPFRSNSPPAVRISVGASRNEVLIGAATALAEVVHSGRSLRLG